MAKKAKTAEKLTTRQQAFVEHYAADPNATKAARLAGYSGDEAALASSGSTLLRNPKVRAALKALQKPATDQRMASANERKQFWTKVMNDPQAAMTDRLKASELLGKTEADFIAVKKHEGKVVIEVKRGEAK